MAFFSLPLTVNALHTEPQTLEFEKTAAFIGGNGSGKSTILKSIFDEKLEGTAYQDYKIVCFSSGQNERYSDKFGVYLKAERDRRNALSLDCFYYDKLWSKLLIFLATTSKPFGLVRKFLKDNGYVAESDFDEDLTTKLSIDVKVDKSYTNLVKQAMEDEAKGESDVITNKSYHLTLRNFINTLIDGEYDFAEPLEQRTIQLNQGVVSQVSFEADNSSSFDSKVMFFTQAADNDYFIVKNSFNLTFEKDDVELRLENLSDGEYQLLFIYALFDLFDADSTLFLLDEADSHLHYKNVEKLWNVFDAAKGGVVTTTHLVDSIAKAGIERLRIVEKGQVSSGAELSKLSNHLRDLSAINNLNFHAYSFFPNVVLIDDENDWIQFKLLAIRKLANAPHEVREIERKLNTFIVIKCNSGYDGAANSEFADKKLKWLSNFVDYLCGHPYNTRNIYLICDRDELPLVNIGKSECSLLVNGKEQKFKNENPKCHLLSWRRREILHYFLSYTAMQSNIDAVMAELNLGERSKLSAMNSGDYATDASYNNSLATIKSKTVKDLVKPYIYDTHAFSEERTKVYVSNMPKEEISEDIVTMYNYLVGQNE